MGLEATTTARVGRKKYDGKLHLDSKSLSFKSPGFRWEVALGETITASAAKGLLVIQNGDEKVFFDVGDAAQKWVNKILNPPSRLTKLGVKPGQQLWLSKGFDKSFTGELKSFGASTVRQIEKCDLAFWKVTKREQLDQLPVLAKGLPGGKNVWIVWTKGSQAISQTDVMNAAKSEGFGPSKTAAFDDEHSSMRFAQKSK